MKKPRTQAALIIAKLLSHQGSLAALGSQVKALSPSDKSLVQALCFGVCRWWWQLDVIAKSLLSKPLKRKDNDVYALLMLGLYQLRYMDTPAHAAINETVQAAHDLNKSWASKLVNAILRRYQRESEVLDEKTQSHHAHPKWLANRLHLAWAEAASDILTANNQHPPMTLRVNLAHHSRAEYLALLKKAGLEGRAGQYAASAVYLNKPVAVDDLPGFHEGWVSVQDESPQLTPELMDLQANLRVLDACSAPGGKTGHLLECEPTLALTALDVKASRLQRVKDNMKRLNFKVTVLEGDGAQPNLWWDGQLFDRILIDAPCSATGIIRRQPDIKLLRQEQDVQALCEEQEKLLAALWPLLAPGGRLVYATCSILPEENSQQIASFVANHSDAKHIPIEAAWGQAQAYGRQLLPTIDGGDGFYYACLMKAPILGPVDVSLSLLLESKKR